MDKSDKPCIMRFLLSVKIYINCCFRWMKVHEKNHVPVEKQVMIRLSTEFMNVINKLSRIQLFLQNKNSVFQFFINKKVFFNLVDTVDNC